LKLKLDLKLNQDSYYEASVIRPPTQPALAGSVRCDVCVLGGGLAGLSTALELVQRGYSVVLLESQRVAFGASGRNGGLLIGGFGTDGEEAIEAQLPPEDARRAWDISLQGLQLVQQRMREHQIDCDYIPGYLTLATSARRARQLAQRTEYLAQHYGHPPQWIAKSEIGNWVASTRYHGGTFDPLSGHLHPLKYALGLAQAARDAGVQIYEHSAVTQLQAGSKPRLRTTQGEVDCRYAVLTGNAYLGAYAGLAPHIASRILPVATYMIATEPMERERADALFHQRAAATDSNFDLNYFRLSADHRLLFGGADTARPVLAKQAAVRLQKRMLDVFPQLSNLGIAHAWGGFCDTSFNRAPDFGRLGDNIYYLQGFSGHGLGTTGIAGRLVAELIAGQAERFDLFTRIRHYALPGGTALRPPVLALGMAYYRLLDWI